MVALPHFGNWAPRGMENGANGPNCYLIVNGVLSNHINVGTMLMKLLLLMVLQLLLLLLLALSLLLLSLGVGATTH